MGTGRTETASPRVRVLATTGIFVAALLALMGLASSARAQVVYTEALPNGAQRTT